MIEDGGGGGYSFLACLDTLTIGHMSHPRRSPVPTPHGDTYSIGVGGGEGALKYLYFLSPVYR